MTSLRAQVAHLAHLLGILRPQAPRANDVMGLKFDIAGGALTMTVAAVLKLASSAVEAVQRQVLQTFEKGLHRLQ